MVQSTPPTTAPTLTLPPPVAPSSADYIMPTTATTTTGDMSALHKVELPSPKTIYEIINGSHVLDFIWFLCIFFIVYLAVGLAFPLVGEQRDLQMSRTMDLLVFSFIVITLYLFVYSKSAEERDVQWAELTRNTTEWVNNPLSVFSLLFFLVIFYIAVYMFRVPMSYENKPMTIYALETALFLGIAGLGIVQFFRHFLQMDIVHHIIPSQPLVGYSGNVSLGGGGGGNIAPPIRGNVGPTISGNITTHVKTPEVFHVANNLYTYDEAPLVCQALGAELATYDQIENAYTNGGEWCGYGWSENQMIFYPTQEYTWAKLQKNPNTKNKCGRPGVNGGFMENKHMTFGVNCYGIKPEPTEQDMEQMARMSKIELEAIAKTPEEIALQEKIRFWKENKKDLLNLHSFNYNQWSE